MQINMLQNKCKDDVVKQSSIFLIGNYHSYFIGCDGNDENGFFFPSLYY